MAHRSLCQTFQVPVCSGTRNGCMHAKCNSQGATDTSAEHSPLPNHKRMHHAMLAHCTAWWYGCCCTASWMSLLRAHTAAGRQARTRPLGLALNLDVQQRLNLLPADRAFVCLGLQRRCTRLTHAHVPARQHRCVALCTHADHTLPPLYVLCWCHAVEPIRVHAINLLQLIARALHPDLLLQDLQAPVALLVAFELGVCGLGLRPYRQRPANFHLQARKSSHTNKTYRALPGSSGHQCWLRMQGCWPFRRLHSFFSFISMPGKATKHRHHMLGTPV